MLRSLGLIGNINKKDLLPLCKRIIRWCHRHKVKVHVEEDLFSHHFSSGKKSPLIRGSLERCDLVCVMGGDGFLLHTAHSLYPIKTPLLPINLGSLGFNTQTEPDSVLKALNKLHKTGIVTSKRYLLEVSPPSEKSPNNLFALNDVLIIKETLSRLIHVRIIIDGILTGEIGCDGMIASTPTGSTAYNLAAGGPLVHPTLPAFTLTPICPHTLSFRPIVLPPSSRVTLLFSPRKDREEAQLCVDGQIWHPLHPGDEVKIATAPDPILIAEVDPEQYYKKLHKRIRWGIPLIQ